jgi:hypothetical protein
LGTSLRLHARVHRNDAEIEGVMGLAPLPATLGFQLSFATVVMERLPQLFGYGIIKNLRAEPPQRFVAPRICFRPRFGEPAFCRLLRSLPQSGAPPSVCLAIVRTLARQSPPRRRPLGMLIVWLWRPAGLPHAREPFLNWRGW